MKKYSAYFMLCLYIGITFSIFSLICIATNYPAFCAVFCTLGFLSYYAGIMAPDDEKYTPEYNEYITYKKFK